MLGEKNRAPEVNVTIAESFQKSMKTWWLGMLEHREGLKTTRVFLVKDDAEEEEEEAEDEEEEESVHRRLRLSLPFSRFSLLS